MTVIKAAAVQLSPVLYSREGTVDKVCRQIIALGRQGVQFATFPETVVPYYPYFSFVQTPYEIRTGKEHLRLLDQAVTVPSAATHAIGEACKQAGARQDLTIAGRCPSAAASPTGRYALRSRFHAVPNKARPLTAAARGRTLLTPRGVHTTGTSTIGRCDTP